MPDKLLFEPEIVCKRMIKEALWYLEDSKKRLCERRNASGEDVVAFHVLASKGQFKTLTKALVNDYWDVIMGFKDPSRTKAYKEADTLEHQLTALIRICQSQYYVMCDLDPTGDYPKTPTNEELNPNLLTCVCKGFRHSAICSHVIACNTLECFGDKRLSVRYLQAMLEKVADKPKKAPHRPRKTVGANRIQPTGDSASEEESEPAEDFDDEEVEVLD